MLWIDLIRIVLPGVVTGVLIGKLVIEKPQYLDPLNPKKWASKAKETTKREAAKIAIISIVLGIISYFAVIFAEEIAMNLTGPNPFISEDNVFTEISNFFYPLLIVSITLIPIFEEWLFRGIILTEIRERTNSKILALLLSSVLFASFHLFNPGTHLLALIPYTMGGIFMGTSYLLGGLTAATSTHIIYNLMPFLLTILI